VVLLSIKDTFTRPLRTVLAIASLCLTVMVAITAVGAQATVDDLARNRVYFNGTSADMKVMRNFVPESIIRAEILSSRSVAGSYEELLLWGQFAGHSDQPIAVRFLDGDYVDFDFPVKEGRMIAGPGEAVMGYAVLSLIGAQVGDTVELSVEGAPVELTIVGRHTEYYNTNKVVIVSLDTYREQVDSTAEPNTAYLRLVDPAQAETLREDWLERSQGWLTVNVIDEEPQRATDQLRMLIVSLSLILMIVAGANLMSTSLLGIRERVRDFGIQKTLGLTPTQIGLSVVIGAITVALFALLLGLTAGLIIMNGFIGQVGIAMGAGTDFYIIPWSGLLLLLPALVLLAVIASLLPAVRAARLEVTSALRYE
jgi:putative ABC transport system permease protein